MGGVVGFEECAGGFFNEVDGEVVGSLPVTFRISSRKLRVVVPVGREP